MSVEHVGSEILGQAELHTACRLPGPGRLIQRVRRSVDMTKG